MRFKWTFLAGAALLSGFALVAQIEAQRPARAQFSAAPTDGSNPISRLPPPPQTGAPKIAPPQAPPRPATSAPKIAPPRATPNPNPTPKPTPKPTPLPKLAPRFLGQSPLRVGLSTAGGDLRFYFPGGATVADNSLARLTIAPGDTAAVWFRAAEKNGITLKTGAGRTLRCTRPYFAISGEAARVTTNGANPKYGRPYRGDLEVFPQKLGEAVKRRGPLALVNVLPLEEYLKGVVPWEMDATAPVEALKAQAICARTKALDFVRSKRFAAGDFEICDYDACQGYPGMENEKAATTQAVESTRGLAIYHGGRPIDAVYSTNSGGVTASADDAWPGGASIPYLQSVRDFAPDSALGQLWQGGMTEAKWAQFCAQSFDSFARPDGVSPQSYEARKYRWTQFVSVEEASKAFAGQGISRVMQIQVMNRNASGRVARLRFTGIDAARFKIQPTPLPAPTPKSGESLGSAVAVAIPIKSVDLAGDGKIRAAFSKRLGSTTALPSSLFTVSPSVDKAGQVIGWNLQGAGWGHGVGMCQRGAQNHARQGWDARRILSFYYRGVEIR